VVDAARLIDDIRTLRGRTDLLDMPRHAPADGAMAAAKTPDAPEHDFVSRRLAGRVRAGDRRGDLAGRALFVQWRQQPRRGIDFAGFAPEPVRDRTCLVFNTIGPDRADTMREMLDHLGGCQFFDAHGAELTLGQVRERLPEFRLPVRERYAGEDGCAVRACARIRATSPWCSSSCAPRRCRATRRCCSTARHWLQRTTKYVDLASGVLLAAASGPEAALDAAAALGQRLTSGALERLAGFVTDVRESTSRRSPPARLALLPDARLRGATGTRGQVRRQATRVRGVDGRGPRGGQDVGVDPRESRVLDFDHFWAGYPGAREHSGVEVTQRGRAFRTTALHAHVWGMHHRYPTNSPAIDAEGRGNPAGAHPFKAYNLLLMHNGEQVAVDSTAPFLCEFGYVHSDPSTLGPGHAHYHGDSVYERKALTDTEYAAYLVDFTRRVLGLDTEDASQIASRSRASTWRRWTTTAASG